MSCNCYSVDRSSLWTSIPKNLSAEMTPGEDVECFAKRSPDSGDKAGGVAPTDKIITNAIVPDCEMKISQQFELSDGSPSDKFKRPVSWKMVSPDDKSGSNGAYTISGLSFSSAGNLSGRMDPQAEGRVFNVMIIAVDADGKEIDSRTYSFSPKKCVTGSDLKFIHPLPGSRMTCKFGPRNPPTSGASSMHKGCDFAYAGGATKDVLASCDGKVVKAGSGTGYGNVVYLHHFNGSGKKMAETRYAHLDSIYVSVGQQVSAGQPIGKEGNTGIGTGAHLHFELRLDGDTPVDPSSYINGQVLSSGAAQDSDGNVDPGKPTGEVKKTVNTNKAVTTAKVEASQKNCKTVNTSSPLVSEPVTQGSPRQSDCAPTEKLSKEAVKQKITEVLDRHPDLDASDKSFLMKIADIESKYDPAAKNPNTNATGLFQMIDSTAEKYYSLIGKEPTCENRCDPTLATEAMVRFYKKEILKYYTEYQNSNGTKIAGKKIKDTPHSARYPSLSKPVFCYGLIHHDGVGNAVNGIDVQGVQIAQRYFT